ncbi:hypothetical protein K7X08_013055 [Anisodus acutangulus]|uniref:BHLH domain-containing protein n=1 Tax=Anisodus acutangulus TaxID=402998 RepID=A0A9Q1RE40_9SOLA|nr:hypothetical protein K7X08_013055 [Anisodus acutangulus]
MEPANLHHHQHQQYHQLQFQDQLPLIGISPNSSSSSNSCYGVSTTNTTNTWTPCTILNSPGNSLNSYSGGAIINTTNSSSSDPLRLRQQLQSGTNLVSMSTTQDLGFHWVNNNISSQLVKQENSLSDSYPRFTQMLRSPSSIEEGELSDMNAKLLLGTLSNTGLQLYPGDNNNLLYSSNSSSTNRGRFSQIYPTINVSNLNINQANSSSSLDMNLQPMDLINSARYGERFSQTYGLTSHFQHSSSGSPLDSSTSISAFSNGVPEAKRTSNTLEPNKGPQNAPKKSRVDSRASCTPFKVRKEKLGDRIAALQQLVAPFGKTDTASVLMEAIGYIKFLQNQVETLSVPYMKSSRSKASRSMHGGGGEMNNGSEEIKRDLRSRGLCLVPLSCLTYVTDGGGVVGCNPDSRVENELSARACHLSRGSWKANNCRVNVARQPRSRVSKVIRCTFSSSSDENGSMAENSNENNADYVNSSVVEAVEVQSGPDGFMIKMKDGRHLKCVHNNPQGGHLPDYAPHPAIVLRMEDGTGLLLPIIVLEMPSVLLMAAVRNVQIARPTMYQVVKEMVEKMGYTVKLVRVTKRVHEAYYAQLYLTKSDNDTEIISFDLRPSDAINIAVRSKVPIQVNKYLAYSDGMRIVESPKPIVHTACSDGLLFTELDRPGKPCIETKEFILVRNMLIAAVEERYRDAALWRDKLTQLRSKRNWI